MQESPSYYGILPASVRYDKSVPPAARLLYSELTALCNKHGYCFAGNEYFAELYGVSVETVSRWISKLARARHIVVTIDQAAHEKRRIYMVEEAYKLGLIGQPLDKKIKIPLDENVNNLLTKKSTALDKKIKHNINSNNTGNKEKEKSAQGAEFAPVKDEVVRNESEAAARPPQVAEYPHTVNGVTYDAGNPIPQHTAANTQDPARFIATAVNDAVQWVEQNADLVTDWFLMAKKPRPTESAAQLAERLRPSIAEFFSYYLQNSEHKVRRRPGDFFQTSFIRWMQSDLFENRQQPAVSNNQYGRNMAPATQSTPGKEVSPYKNLSWF